MIKNKQVTKPLQKMPYCIVLNRWLEAKTNKVKQSTLSRYDYLIRKYISPSLGSCTVESIQRPDVDDFASNLLSHGGKNDSGLSPKTVNDILSILKCSLTYAYQDGTGAPFDLKQLRVREYPKEMRVLSIQEQEILQAFLMKSPDRSKLGILLSLYTGIRIGELCALKWEHIRMEQGILKIHETLQRVHIASGSHKTQIIVSSPKSKCSFRSIPLPPFLIELIAPYQGAPDAYFLTGKRGTYTEPRVLQNRFKKYLRDCGLPDVNYHCLRHTFATRCVELGFDIKTLSEILGHTNVNITLDKYVHSSIELKRSQMLKLEKFASLN